MNGQLQINTEYIHACYIFFNIVCRFFSLGKYLKILERFVFEQYSDFNDVDDLAMSQ